MSFAKCTILDCLLLGTSYRAAEAVDSSSVITLYCSVKFLILRLLGERDLNRMTPAAD